MAYKESLNRDGYCVVPNVLSPEDCDRYAGQLKDWHRSFPANNGMRSRNSLVKGYAIGHSEAAWVGRLAAKPVFAALWNTHKLLSSMDAIGLAPPPSGTEEADKGQMWLHCDQKATRQGLHAYQGALYLEATEEDDYCLRVLARSHNCHELFFNSFPAARKSSLKEELYKLTGTEVKWYEKQGCELKTVTVPKGGLALWDSRTIHDNRPPLPFRQHADRWRVVVFVCMTPASWASKEDLSKKRRAYEEVILTNHYASQMMKVLDDKTPANQKAMSVSQLPAVAKTLEARQLAGVEAYEEDDEEERKAELFPAPVWLDA